MRLVNSLRPVRGGAAEVVAALRDWLAVMAEPVPLVVETSGSTGHAQAGRARPARGPGLRARVRAPARGRGQWLLALPASYVAGVQVVCRSLVAGHEPVVVEGSFAATLAGLPHHRDVPLFTSLVPTQLHRLLDRRARGRGAAPPAHDPARRRARSTRPCAGGPRTPGLHVVATYGASETAGGCVYDGHPLDGVAVAIGDRRPDPDRRARPSSRATSATRS